MCKLALYYTHTYIYTYTYTYTYTYARTRIYIHTHSLTHIHTPPAHLQIEPARQHHINRRGKQDPRPIQNHPERVTLVQYEGEHPGEEDGPEPGPPWTAEADADEVVFDDDGEDGDAGEDRRGGE